MTFSKKYSTTLTEMSRAIKQKFQGLSVQQLSAMLTPIREWFHLNSDEAALMLSLIIYHKSSTGTKDFTIDELDKHYSIPEEWKPKLLKGLYYLIEKGISFPCIYSGNLERFSILLSDKVLNSIRTQSCYTPDDAHKHDRISAIFYFYSLYHAWRSELFINESAFNLQEELYGLMRFLDPERRRGLCELSAENQLILVCLFVHRFSGNEPLPFPDFLKLVCLSEERERQLRYDIESEVNFLVASSIFYIDDLFGDEMFVCTNLDRLRKLVLGDMPNPDAGIRPVIHPLHWVDLSRETETLYFPAAFNRKLSDFVNLLKDLLPQFSSDTNNFTYKRAKFIYGGRGMGKTALVYRIARELGGDVYRYDFNDVVIQALSDYKMHNPLREFQRFVEKAKQLCQNGSIVILDNFIDPERLLNSQNLPFSEIYALTRLIEKFLREPTGIIFVISRQPLSPKSSLRYYFDEIVHVPDSTKDSRKDFLASAYSGSTNRSPGQTEKTPNEFLRHQDALRTKQKS